MEDKGLEIINAKLSALNDEDIRAIVEIERHPAVRRWLIDHGDESLETELEGYRKFFQELANNNRVEVLVAKIRDRVVGFLAFWRMEGYDKHTRSIGISVHPDYWGRGIATALIREIINLARRINVKRIVIETLKENHAMRRVAEKIGFKMETIKMNKNPENEKYYDEIFYSLEL